MPDMSIAYAEWKIGNPYIVKTLGFYVDNLNSSEVRLV